MSCDDIAKGPPSIGHHIGNIRELLWKNMIFKTKLVDTRKKRSTFVYFIDYIQTMHLDEKINWKKKVWWKPLFGNEINYFQILNVILIKIWIYNLNWNSKHYS